MTDAASSTIPHACPLCGGPGRVLHADLEDRLYATPGHWCLLQCTATSCALLWLTPPPADGTAVLMAYDEYHTHRPPEPKPTPGLYARMESAYLARRYGYPGFSGSLPVKMASRAVTAIEGRRADFDNRVMYLPYSPGSHLLDVGCGNGDFLVRMSALGWIGEGIEPDDRAAAVARRQNVQVRTGTLQDTTYPDACFDAITLSHVIEHVQHPARLIASCQRLLRPGGTIVVVTPNAESWAHRLYGPDWRGLEPPRHLHLFTRRALSRLASSVGLAIRTCRSVAHARSIFMESRALHHGQPVHAPSARSFPLRRWADVMELLEWTLTLINADVGEDLLLIATRSSSPA